MENTKTLPSEVMDYIGKSLVYVKGYITGKNSERIKEHISRYGERLLDIYEDEKAPYVEDDSAQLMDCPFCRSRAIIKDLSPFDNNSTYYDVKCINEDCFLCDGAGWMFGTKMEAILLWNKREFIYKIR